MNEAMGIEGVFIWGLFGEVRVFCGCSNCMLSRVSTNFLLPIAVLPFAARFHHFFFLIKPILVGFFLFFLNLKMSIGFWNYHFFFFC